MRKLVLLVTIVGALLTFASIKRTWTDGDEGRYLSLARSVSLGQGQSLIHLPTPRPEWLTPPAYVWILGQLDRMTHGSMLALRLFSVAGLIASFWFFALFAVRSPTLDSWSLFCALVIGLFSVQSLAHGWLIMTEAPFMAIAALILYLTARLNPRPSRGAVFAIGMLCGFSMLIRPAGIALLPAVFIVLLLRRAWTACALLLAGFALCYSPTIVRSYQLAGVPFPHMTHFESGHAASTAHHMALGGMLKNVFVSFPGYFFVHLPEHLFYSLFDYRCVLCLLHLGFLVRPLSILLALLVAAGFLSRMRHPGAAEFYWIFAWPFLCVYNQPDYAEAGVFLYQPRYLIPLLPLAGLYLVAGIQVAAAACRLAPEKRTAAVRIVAGACAAYVLLAGSAAAATRFRNEWRVWGASDFAPERQLLSSDENDRAFGRYLEAAQWLATNVPDDAIIASRKPDHVYLVSGRKGFRYDGADTGAHGTVWEILMSQKTAAPLYILQDAFPAYTGYGRVRASGLDPEIAAHSSDLELVHVTDAPVTRIWRVKEVEGH